MLRRHFGQNMGSDDFDILNTLAQGRYTHGSIEYQLVQVFREQALVGQTFEVGIAGGDNAHVKFFAHAGLAVHQTVFQSVGQLVAHFHGQLFDFV